MSEDRQSAYRARLKERLERAPIDAEYAELRQRADMPYDQGMTDLQLATSLAYIEWPYSVHVDRIAAS